MFPASFAQRRLWFLDQLMPGNPFYNLAAAIPLAFAVDTRTFEKSLNELVRRHEILRTAFAAVDGEPYQVVLPELRLHLDVDDVQELTDGEREEIVRRLATDNALEPFDLSQAPLLRARLVRHGPHAWTFLLTMHHIISDGWSVGLFFQELEDVYAAFRRGRPSPLPELPIQYGDYAVWQRERLRGDVLEAQAAYWKRRLADAPVLELPTDRPRPVAQSFRGGAERVSIPMGVRERLRALSRRQDATLFMVLLATFTVVLQRYSGQDDIVVGLPVAGRNHRLVERLIGFFINSLVLRTDLSGDPSFVELLARIRETTLGAFEYQDLPFEKLVEELHVERDLSRNPLFQVTFQLINAPTLTVGHGAAAQPAATPAPPPEVERGTAMFDLAFDVIETPDGLLGRVEYSTDLFDAATIASMARHFEALLAEVAARPERRLSELSSSTSDELALIEQTNNTAREWDGAALLHELVAEQAAKTPAAPAIAAADGTVLAYRELAERSHQLARELRAQGVRPGTLVGVCMERSPELLVALLGILESGGAYVPLDPGYPASRLAAMTDAVALVLAHPHLADRLGGTDIPVVCLDGSWALVRRRRRTPLPPAALPDDIAYVIYTSGSAGAPKGVVVTHRSISNHMRWMLDAFPLSDRDRVLQRTPASFDASVWELFGPLMAGACLVLAPAGEHADPTRLVEIIRRQRVTVVQLVPSLLRLLLDEPGVVSCTSLTRVFCGGETLTSDLRDRCLDTLPASLVNLYGPTEATVDALSWACAPEERGSVVPIGRPVANCRAYVLDRRLEPVPLGVPGELYLGGDGVALGYLGKAGLTADRFVPDPFGPHPGKRLYRTGDRVRRLPPDGVIQHIGREDRQLKVRGVRIELGEIEAVLRRHDGVGDAAVIAHEAATGDQRLAAYVVVGGGRPTPAELVTFLRTQLAEQMVPSSVTVLDALPLAPNGKLDYRRLPEPRPRGASSRERVPPRTALESFLAALWADILHVDEVGVHDGFFNDLGGHSLLATQLLSRVRDILDVDVPLKRVFEAPTVAQFSASLAEDGEMQARLERTAELFLLVKGLSDEDVDAMLAGRERTA
jgi:amino acid adenylation domain-containing protein